MRALSLALLLSVLTIFPTSGNAGDAHPFQIAAASDGEKVQLTNPNNETYRGHFLDLSSIARRQDFAVMADTQTHALQQTASLFDHRGQSRYWWVIDPFEKSAS